MVLLLLHLTLHTILSYICRRSRIHSRRTRLEFNHRPKPCSLFGLTPSKPAMLKQVSKKLNHGFPKRSTRNNLCQQQKYAKNLDVMVLTWNFSWIDHQASPLHVIPLYHQGQLLHTFLENFFHSRTTTIHPFKSLRWKKVFNFDLLKSSFLLALLPIRLLEGLEGDIVLLLEMKLRGAHIRV